MVPIIHTICGKQTAWYLRDEGVEGDIFSAKDYMRMNGTQPKYGDVFRERCASCGEVIVSAMDLKRDFSDKRPNVEGQRGDGGFIAGDSAAP